MSCAAAIHRHDQSADQAPTRHRPSFLALIWDGVRACHETASQRRALAALDAHLLDDIGLGHGTARAEAAKPFWRV